VKACEDCGEPATRETSDGVWLCEADYQHLCDCHFADTYNEALSTPLYRGE
jgi:ribosomal protein L37AE/L43A